MFKMDLTESSVYRTSDYFHSGYFTNIITLNEEEFLSIVDKFPRKCKTIVIDYYRNVIVFYCFFGFTYLIKEPAAKLLQMTYDYGNVEIKQYIRNYIHNTKYLELTSSAWLSAIILGANKECQK
jgi:hypothetical protein